MHKLDNGYSTEIELYEDYNQLYILNDANHKVKFTAPENGFYTINTYGNVKNSLGSSVGEISAIDCNNKELVVDLNKGDELFINVTKNNFEGSDFIGIAVEFTPEEIIKGETKTLSIAPNQREFYGFNSEEDVNAFKFNVLSTSKITVSLYKSNLNTLQKYISGNNLFSSTITNNEMYFIGVKNNTNNEITVDITINNVEKLNTVQNRNIDIVDEEILMISPEYNSGYKISIESLANIEMKIYDENNNLINLTQTLDTHLSQYFESTKKYFVKLKNYSSKMKNAIISLNLTPEELDLGNNHIMEISEKDLFACDSFLIDYKYKIDTNAIIDVYDSNFILLQKDDENCYLFESGEKYYFAVKSYNENAYIKILLNANDERTGTYSIDGETYIKFIPTSSAAYNIEGANNFIWYNHHLVSCGSYLYEGEVYYLKISGTPMSQFNIQINLISNQLPVNRSMSIRDGYYYFKIEEEGNYSINISHVGSISSSVTLYYENGSIVMLNGEPIQNKNIRAEALTLLLTDEIYYIDLHLSRPDARATIRINKL